jgi:hypothetical protein
MEEENSMAEPLRKDEPLSAVRWPESPSNPVVVRERPLLPEDLPSRPLGEWPHADITEAAVPPSADTRLQEAGEAVGSALGAVVNEAREIPGWLQHRAQERITDLKRRFQVIRSQDPADLKKRAEEFAGEAENKIVEVARDARREAMHWKFRARVYARRDPLHFVAGAAAAGFAIGFLLRLWGNE